MEEKLSDEARRPLGHGMVHRIHIHLNNSMNTLSEIYSVLRQLYCTEERRSGCSSNTSRADIEYPCFACCSDRSRMPELGFVDVLDGVRHLLTFALDLLTVGLIDEQVDSEYIQGLEWYGTLPGILAGDDDGV